RRRSCGVIRCWWMCLVERVVERAVRRGVDPGAQCATGSHGELNGHDRAFRRGEVLAQRLIDVAPERDATLVRPGLRAREETIIDRQCGAHDAQFSASRASRAS